jgi:nucleoside-diphosphate-sugar epimerase
MERLLIVGAGDIARRALPALAARYQTLALIRSGGESLAQRGVATLAGDLDHPESLARLADCADVVLHLAPPNDCGERDERIRNLIAALASGRMVARRFVYLSTSGVYGDCAGAKVDESHPPNPRSARAQRRADAERVLREWSAAYGVRLTILRAPGIYAADRLPLERLARGTPVLRAEEDVYTNHIHADDLAAICVRSLERDAPAGVFNANDDSELKMGDYFDLVADRFRFARPPRVSRAEAEAWIPPALLSFMNESRRLDNRRMKATLGVELRYPTVFDGVPITQVA